MNTFAKLAEIGYPLSVPIIPPDAEISEDSSLFSRVGTKQDGRGKTPGVRRSNGAWSSFNWVPHVPDARDYDRWHAMGAGVGIKTGHGILAIDADTTDEDAAALIQAEVTAFFGQTPVRIGRAPKALYLVATDHTPVPYMRVDFGQRDERGVPERVEILSEGRQFVAQGIHPKTLQPYHWPSPIVPAQNLPKISFEDLQKFMQRLKEILPLASEIQQSGGSGDYDQEQLIGDPALIRKAVAAIPNDARFDTRESYLNVGYAIRAAIPDDEPEAFEIFADWCDRWENGSNPRHVIEADWRRMKPPYRRGAQWLYEMAETAAPDKFSQAEVWFEPVKETENPWPEIYLNALSQETGKPGRFHFKPFSALHTFDPGTVNPALIKGLIDQGAMSVLYGDSNAGKTFVALDLCYHVATGRPYNGLRTTQAPVAYIAAEGGRGAEKRVVALRNKFPEDQPEDVKLALLAAPVDLLRPDADLNDLLADLAALPETPGLIVVDTLSRALAGGDENSSVDMGAIVKHLDALRAATGAHVMVVHHTGKDKAKGARGHSLLRAATDTEVEVADAGKVAGVQTGTIGVTKQRDLDKSWAGNFALDVHTLGLDPDGDVVTSCSVRFLSGDDLAILEEERAADKEASAGVPTDAEQEVLDALEALEGGAGEASAGVSAVVLAERLSRPGREVTRQVARVFLQRLQTKCLVEVKKRGLYGLKAKTKILSSQGPRRQGEDKPIFRGEDKEDKNGHFCGSDIFQ